MLSTRCASRRSDSMSSLQTVRTSRALYSLRAHGAIAQNRGIDRHPNALPQNPEIGRCCNCRTVECHHKRFGKAMTRSVSDAFVSSQLLREIVSWWPVGTERNCTNSASHKHGHALRRCTRSPRSTCHKRWKRSVCMTVQHPRAMTCKTSHNAAAVVRTVLHELFRLPRRAHAVDRSQHSD